MKRLPAIDTVRGIAITLMILDHTRFFFSTSAFSPTNLQHTTPALFATRWITHIAAVAFILLAGVSIHLYGQRHGDQQTRPFLLRRGIMITLLELTLVKFCWNYRMDFSMTYLQVIWAIGWSMILLAGCLAVPRRIALPAALCCILSPYVAPPVTGMADTPAELLSALLCTPGTFSLPSGMRFHTTYPILPWFGIMWTGYLAAPTLLNAPPDFRKRIMGMTGLLFLSLFAAIRWISAADDSLMGFLNVHKYPPHPDFLLLTTGMIILLYLAVERIHERSGSAADTALRLFTCLGRAPLVIYMAHLIFLQMLRNAINWYPAVFSTVPFLSTTPDGFFPLYTVYILAAFTTACMLPAALLFIRVKGIR